jgi:hypothetical protein
LEAQAGAGIELGMWQVGVKGCALPLTGNVSLSACLGPKLGDMYGRGNEQLENRKKEHDRWSALAAELSVAVSGKSGWMTLLGVELGRTLEAPRFGIRANGRDKPVFEAPSWTFNGFLGFGQSR